MSAFALPGLRSATPATDEQLMWRVQHQDDAAAFAELVGRWQGPIQRLCARMTGDEHHAEDLAQEVFTRLFTHRQNFQHDARFSTYLWRIALNQSYNELRRPRHRHEFLTVLPAEGEPSAPEAGSEEPTPDQQAVHSETAQAVRQAVMSLAESHRAVLILRHYEGLKFREIAEVLGLPEGTVKTRMTEALSNLARRLRRTLDLNVAPPPHGRARLNATPSL